MISSSLVRIPSPSLSKAANWLCISVFSSRVVICVAIKVKIALLNLFSVVKLVKFFSNPLLRGLSLAFA